MFSFPNNTFSMEKSMQKYIEDSLKKSIQKKKNKNSIYFIKYPIECDLNYLKCDYNWSKPGLFKYFDSRKVSFYNNRESREGREGREGNMDNNLFTPFFFYLAFTTSFFVFEQCRF